MRRFSFAKITNTALLTLMLAQSSLRAADVSASPGASAVSMLETFPMTDNDLRDDPDYIKRDTADLPPQILQRYRLLAQASGLPLPDIYVSALSESVGPDSCLLQSKDGTPFILINEAENYWTQEYVREYVRKPTDQQLDQRIKEGSLVDASAELAKTEEGRDVLAGVEAMAKRMNLAVRPVYIDKENDLEFAYAGYNNTAEDKPFIVVNEPFMALPARIKLAFLGHEYGHFKNGDDRWPSIIRAHNDLQEARQSEIRADLMGSGPLGTGDRCALEEGFELSGRQMQADYLRAHPGSTAADYREGVEFVKDALNHPLISERIAALEDARASDAVKPLRAPSNFVGKTAAKGTNDIGR